MDIVNTKMTDPLAAGECGVELKQCPSFISFNQRLEKTLFNRGSRLYK